MHIERVHIRLIDNPNSYAALFELDHPLRSAAQRIARIGSWNRVAVDRSMNSRWRSLVVCRNIDRILDVNGGTGVLLVNVIADDCVVGCCRRLTSGGGAKRLHVDPARVKATSAVIKVSNDVVCDRNGLHRLALLGNDDAFADG